jgi:recombination associated protein RdgC
VGIQSGTVSLSRFRMLNAEKSYKLNELNPLLENYRSGPISLKKIGKELSFGWVRPLGLDDIELPPDAHWDMTHTRVGDGYMMRMRVEKRAVPAPLVQILYKQEIYKFQAESGELPARKERTQIKDDLKRELLSKSLPAISHVDAYWNEKRSDLTVFSTSKAAKTILIDLFMKSFGDSLGITIVPIEPPLLGLSSEEWEDADSAEETLDLMQQTVPLSFTGQVHP